MGARFRAGALGIGLATALGAALGACTQEVPPPVVETVQPTITPDKTTPPTPEPEPEPEPALTWPLTGVETTEVAQRPAIAVKIENSVEARPQEGLEFADMVWEEVVEGGITRYVAVYHSQIPERVLPIRSARPMDAAIVAPLGGILVYSGAQPIFIDMINAAGVQSMIMDSGHPGFFRVSEGRFAPHNVAGTMATFLANARDDRTAPPPAQAAYATDPEHSTARLQGDPVQTLDVRLSGVQRTVWTWDAATSRFLRADGTTPSMSAAGSQLGAANVILISVTMADTGTVDPAGNPVPETVMTGSGAAVFAADGYATAGTWSKGDTAAPMQFFDEHGDEALLAPGPTWLLLVPTSGSWALS